MTTSLVAALVASCAVAAPTTAHAAAEGPGLRLGGVFVGAYLTSTNGSNAFCAEPDGNNPTAEMPAIEMTSLRAYRMQSNGHRVAAYTNESGLRMMNYLTATYGTLGSGDDWQNRQAAAVALSIWTIRGWDDAVVAGWVAALRAQAPSEVGALVDRFVTEAGTATVGAKIVPPAHPTITWTSGTEATVTVPAGYERFRVESGGRFRGEAPAGVSYSQTATSATLDPSRAHTLSLESVPTLTSPRALPMTVRASWSQTITRWPARLWGFQPGADATDQLLVIGGGSEQLSDSGEWTDATAPTKAPAFAPVLTTKVERSRLDPDDGYLDRVTFGLGPGSAPWPRYWADGDWRPRSVRATGTLYGPLSERPEPAAEPPAERDLPIAGTAVVDADRGAGTYDVSLDAPAARAPGFYTWVWQIDGSEQGAEIQVGDRAHWHIAADYRFRDGYGLIDETHLRPMEFSIATALRDRELPPGGSTTDTITVDPGAGGWLEHAGAPVPVTFRATVYEVAGDPVRSAAAPADARVRAIERVTATGADDPLTVPVDVPLAREGGVTVQVCVLAEDQPAHVRDLVAERCDDWGIPAESARIVVPRVSTRAQPSGRVGSAIHDVATVRGPVPESSSLGFTAYLLPTAGAVKFDPHWRPILAADGTPERWSAAELARLDDDGRCLAQPVARTARIEVHGPGSVRSPEVVARSAGTVHWVEDLSVTAPDDGSRIELHRGVCGAAHETTRVTEPERLLSATGGALWGVFAGGAAALLSGAGLLALVRCGRPRGLGVSA